MKISVLCLNVYERPLGIKGEEMTFNIERAGRPVFGSKVQAPDRLASQQVSFQAALQRAAAPASAPGDGPQTVEQLIEKLRGDIVDGVEPQADEMRGAMALDQVMTFLDRQPPAERQAAMLRLAEAFPKDAGAENPRSAWVTNGIDYAAALSDLATDPAEAKRREGEETFASGIYDRGNRLMYHPDETDDSQGALAKDIRAFLDQTTRGAGEDASGMKWQVLNRLYERDWVDAGPVMGAIEQVAAEDFGQELLPTSHQGAGTHAAAQAIYGRAAAMGGYSETQAYGILEPAILRPGARRPARFGRGAAGAGAEAVRRASGAVVAQPVRHPAVRRRPPLDAGERAGDVPASRMADPGHGRVAGGAGRQPEPGRDAELGGPARSDRLQRLEGRRESWGDSALWNLQAVANRIEGTSAGDAVRVRMRDYGMIGD